MPLQQSRSFRAKYLGAVLFGLAATPIHPADTVSYDTAWSFSYDAGLSIGGRGSMESFMDIEQLPNGDFLCVGAAPDSAETQGILSLRLSASGQAGQTKVFSFAGGAGAVTLLHANNGDFVVGGQRYRSPLLLRLDSNLNIKSAFWHYDSVQRKPIFPVLAAVNSVVELENGRIAASAGNIFPDNYGSTLDNFAGFMEFDSTGVRRTNHWHNTTGSEIAGWSLVKGETFGYQIGGKQAGFLLDSVGVLVSKNEYTVSVAGVGSEKNKISRLRKLKDGRIIIVGQSYEEDSWTRNQRLNFDAWWTTLSAGGAADARNVSGVSGRDDFLWDVAQLADGRIAFVGGKGTAADSGIWAFVTDSTGRTIQWQKQYNLPGRINGSFRDNLFPMAVQPTLDSGFVVVGVEGGGVVNDNAFAFKFARKVIPVSGGRAPNPAANRGFWEGRAFKYRSSVADDVVLELYGLDGALAARLTSESVTNGQGRIMVPEARCKGGLYFWRARLGRTILSGKSIF